MSAGAPLQYWLATFATLVGFWLVGHGALTALRIGPRGVWSSFFAKAQSGALLSVLAYAAWVTRGRTVLLGLIVVALCHWRELWACRGNERPALPSWRQLAGLVAVTLLVLALLTLRFSDSSERSVFVDNADFALYAMAADWITISGQENNNAGANLISDAYRGLVPYHYYDLYLAKLVSLPFRLLTLHSYAISATAVGAVLVYLGILALLERLQGARFGWRSHVAALLFLASTGLTLPFYYAHPFVERLLIGSFDTPALSSLNFLRSSSTQALLLASALLVSNGRDRLANGALLLLPLVSFTMAPGVLAGLGVLAVLGRAGTRAGQSLPTVRAGPPLLLGVFLATAYSVAGAQMALRRATIFHIDSLWNVLALAYGLKWLLRTVVFYWPFLALAAWLLWSRRSWFPDATGALRPLATRYLAILGCGLVVGTALRENFDGIQAFSNLARESSLVLAVWLWASLGASALPYVMRLVFRLGYAWLFIGSVVYTLQFNVFDNHADGRRNTFAVSRPFLDEARGILGEGRYEQVATLGSWSRYPLGGVLFGNARNDVGIQHIDLTERDESVPGWDYARLVKNSVFANVSEQRARRDPGLTPGELKLAFCREAGVEIILYPPGAALDRELLDRVMGTIEDSKTGLRLSRLQVWEHPAR